MVDQAAEAARPVAQAGTPLLSAEGISHHYGATPVLHSVSISALPGEIVCLLGPSGCGKSTLLRVIVGLESGYSGSVRFAGQAMDQVPVHQRGFGLMFQDFALFPHRTVAENVGFGLRMQRLDRTTQAARVAATLELVGLTGYGDRTIFALSGGERQRVALARSLAPQPRLLLLDEPLGALDRTLRERLTEELRLIITRVGLTSVYVTHDQAEAFAVADRIVLMDAGRIVQSGSPAEVYQQPATVFAARFLGFENVLPATILACHADHTVIDTALGMLTVATSGASAQNSTHVVIRPEAALPANNHRSNVINADMLRSSFRGASERVVVRHSSGIELSLDLPVGLAATTSIDLHLRPDALALVNET